MATFTSLTPQAAHGWSGSYKQRAVHPIASSRKIPAVMQLANKPTDPANPSGTTVSPPAAYWG